MPLGDNPAPGPAQIPAQKVAVIGSGISGLSAAWLLSRHHDVQVFEASDRIGGHSNTVEVQGRPVDTGFIVYNTATYPNLTALFDHLGVATRATDMGFAVSLDQGRLEYAGGNLGGLFAQKRNLASPRFWRMLSDLVRFYRQAPRDLPDLHDVSLGDYLDRLGMSTAFRDDHLYPMAAAIWSTPVAMIPDQPAAAFIRFCENHGLLNLGTRPAWRTVEGGSRAYVERLSAPFADAIHTATPVRSIRRLPHGVELQTDAGPARFDAVVVATHADRALALLADADADERRVLGAFGYRPNLAVLHSDTALMPLRRRVWSAWNYASIGDTSDPSLSVTYWMNRLQTWLPDDLPLFVTLNPLHMPDPAKVHATIAYDHPVFDMPAGRAQGQLWDLQGRRRTWFCGAHFGAGFHEDGLQAGLAVAEDIGGVRRPWQVADESGRIQITRPAIPAKAA
ncbi:NAD(P)/FAD-dependent oxidoreductase [Novosphingobium acidiphilum]|uniref:NAD(P)/FAD-dependent oxidoreductase n=1 Tax=Novosphingobium acidiphilum TaxID=505248 RepID=UPI00040793B8|nr:FAD-dependent oxidoreductase [Novosphingobium acidiphilum]